MRLFLLAGSTLLASALAAVPALATTFDYTGAEQTFVVPTSGLYDIVAYGAQGGLAAGSPYVAGRGAKVGGELSLTIGEALTILVGEQGGISSDPNALPSGGGGGGSFVVAASGSRPLVIAGGGGGGPASSGGQTGTAGASGFGTGNAFGGAGGDSGAGGGPGTAEGFVNAGGGGGLTGGGGGGTAGGQSFLAGGAGGAGISSSVFGAGVSGGFGGGGGADAAHGGGGGGYSGGGGGGSAGGGGGGSYLDASATNAVLVADENSGNGFVTITPVLASVPEPASLALFGTGLAGFGLIRRRRRG